MQEILYKSHYKEEYGNRQPYDSENSEKSKIPRGLPRTFIPKKRNKGGDKLSKPFTSLGKHSKNGSNDIHRELLLKFIYHYSVLFPNWDSQQKYKNLQEEISKQKGDNQKAHKAGLSQNRDHVYSNLNQHKEPNIYYRF